MLNGEKVQVGIDIVELSRIHALLSRWGKVFLNKVYTLREQEEYNKLLHPVSYLAGRWAAKEAIIKAIGNPCSWTDLEITRGVGGRPNVILLNKAKTFCSGQNEDSIITISISHSKEYAVAVAVLAVSEKYLGKTSGKRK